MEQALFTVQEAANRLKLHPKTVRQKIRSGAIGSTRVGHQYRITQRQLDAFCGVEGSAPATTPAKSPAVQTLSVIDAEGIDRERHDRVTGTVLAVLNNHPTGARVDFQYTEASARLRIVVSGDLEGTREVLGLLEVLLPRVGRASTSAAASPDDTD